MTNAKMGRPTKYKEEYAEQARKLCLKGFTDKDLAEFFEVEEKTINNWKRDQPDFLHAIKSGKQYSDDAIVNSLYHKALGYSLTEEKEEESEDGFKKVKTIKQVAGDTTAMIFWLKNRQPETWRDKQNIEHSGTVSDLSDDEINRKLAALVASSES